MLAQLGNKKGFYAQCPDCTRVHFVTDGDRRCATHRAQALISAAAEAQELIPLDELEAAAGN